MKPFVFTIILLAVLFGTHSCSTDAGVKIRGELKTWHCVTLDIAGPDLSETDPLNPFLDYRLDVVFSRNGKSYRVPGFFAADGDAAESGASSGNVWRVHFTPDAEGQWNYEIIFLTGSDISIAGDLTYGKSLPAHGLTGSFTIEPSDKKGRDFRGKGRLVKEGHYLRHAGNGEYFLKAGADSPENFLGYIDFDATWYGGNREHRKGESAPNLGLHAYEPHIPDWNAGDPQWQGDKGKGIIGALNYLASKEMNSVYMLTMNILGDGDDVWPYTVRNERYRFDCSKLAQWEKVFQHMDSLGIMLHFVLQETENECLLDAGYLDVQRKLYLRELTARFAHHLAITWNLGEEHHATTWSPYGQTLTDTKKMAEYLMEVDPYDHFIVVHTHAGNHQREKDMMPYLGYPVLDGPSIQVGNPVDTYEQTLKWRKLSADSLHPWVVCLDETGPAWKGALPDSEDPGHDTIRHHVLWANLMAGGGGVEWYFGYRFEHNDLNCEDWRSRDILWDQTRYAVNFFREHLPFFEMQPRPDLVRGAYCLALENQVYALYIPEGGEAILDLSGSENTYSVFWFNPKSGGELQIGSKESVTGGGRVSTGESPSNRNGDWVCLFKALNENS